MAAGPAEPLTTRGVVVRAPGSAARVEELLIDPPGPGEVRVRVLATGVCHTDLHTRQGNFGTEFPYLLGHEATGVVESIGEGVARPTIGETVMLSWRAPCGACRFCAAGSPHRCARPTTAQPRMRTSDGLTLSRVLGLGTFATHTVVAAGQAIPVPASARPLAPEATCLIGCAVATGVGAALYAGAVGPSSTVAVFGCGAVGISVIQGARLAHAAQILAVDLVPRKLEWARSLGATAAIDARTGDPVARIKELTGGAGVTHSFEAVGLPQTVAQALASCDVGATCVVIGVPAPRAELAFSLSRFFFRRQTLRATSYGDCLPSRDFPLLARLYAAGELRLDELVSARIGLNDVEAAFDAMERGEVLRSVILP